MTKWQPPSPPPLQVALPPRQLLHLVPLRRQGPCLQASPTAILLSRVSFLPAASLSNPDTLSSPAMVSHSSLDIRSNLNSPAMASPSSQDIRSKLSSLAMASPSSPTPSLRQQPLLQSQRKKA